MNQPTFATGPSASTNTGGPQPSTFTVAVAPVPVGTAPAPGAVSSAPARHPQPATAVITRPSVLTSNTSVAVACLVLLASLLPLRAADTLQPLYVTTNGAIRAPNSTNFWNAQATNLTFVSVVQSLATNGTAGITNLVTAATNDLALTLTNRSMTMTNAVWGSVLTSSNALYTLAAGMTNATWSSVLTSSNAIYTLAAGMTNANWGSVLTASNALYSASTAMTNGTWGSVLTASNSLYTLAAGMTNATWGSVLTTSNALYTLAVGMTNATWGSVLTTSNALYSSSAGMTNGLWQTILSVSNYLGGFYGTNIIVHWPTNTMGAISNLLYTYNSNYTHYFTPGTYYGWTTSPSGNEATGTLVTKNARGLRLIGLGEVVFLITNSLSSTGSIVSAVWPEPIMSGSFLAFENFQNVVIKDIAIVYDRAVTNRYGPIMNRNGSAIHLFGTNNAGDILFDRVKISGAPGQGINDQTSQSGTPKLWTNVTFRNCWFEYIGTTNLFGGTNGVLNPSGSKPDGAAIYVTKGTKVDGCFFKENVRDIEYEKDVASTFSPSAGAQEYQGFVHHNRFQDWLQYSQVMTTTNWVVNCFLDHNLWVHSNTVAQANTGSGAAIYMEVANNIWIDNNQFVGCFTPLIWAGASQISDIYFKNNLCVSNMHIMARVGTPVGGRIWMENNIIKWPQNRILYDVVCTELYFNFNTVLDPMFALGGMVIGQDGSPVCLSNCVINYNYFKRTNSPTGKLIAIGNNTQNTDFTAKGNTFQGFTTNLYDSLASARETLTNAPSAAGIMYTNSILESSLQATFALGATSSVAVVVWEKNFGVNTYRAIRYGPLVNGGSTVQWQSLNVPRVPPRAIFTVTNGVVADYGGTNQVVGWNFYPTP